MLDQQIETKQDLTGGNFASTLNGNQRKFHAFGSVYISSKYSPKPEFIEKTSDSRSLFPLT
jgi:hypothetical protein